VARRRPAPGAAPRGPGALGSLNGRRSRTVRLADRKGFVMRVLTLIVVTLALIPAMVSAQDLATSLSPMASHLDLSGLPATATAETAPPPAPAATRSSRGVLIPLYASFAALQALDAHSTSRGIHRGAVEQNPMLHSIADNPAALFAVKAGVAASTIVIADKVRSRSRVGAIALMAGLNSLYATIVVHNYAAVR
jgi:hypothetical protein